MKHNMTGNYKNVRLRLLTVEDLEFLRLLRNDKELTKFLKPVGEITIQMQQAWFESDRADMQTYTFAIDETETLRRFVGSVALYDFKDGVCEFGRLLVDKKASGRSIGLNTTIAAMYIAFEQLGVRAVKVSVHENNIPALKAYIKSGFCYSGLHPYAYSKGDEYEFIMEYDHFRRINKGGAYANNQ